MKIINLLEAFKLQVSTTLNADSIFSESGMVKDFPKFEFGFFPVGSGVFNDNCAFENAELSENGTMIIGNDFGTIKYAYDQKKKNREDNSKTIKNLKAIGLDIDNTFFTNFFMGLRDTNNHPKMTMTKLTIQRQKEYKYFCATFFKRQLELINPKVVICLGTEVGKAIGGMSDIFAKFTLNKSTLTKLYTDPIRKDYIINTNDKVFGERKFILIPHPSYAHINWNKNDIQNKIKSAIQI